MFEVCAKKCDQCLFSDKRIVSKARAAQVLREAAKRDAHFVCHKHTIRDGDAQVCCAGFYEANPGKTNLMRIAARLHAVVFVDETGKEVTPEGFTPSTDMVY